MIEPVHPLLKPSDLDLLCYDFDGVMTDNRVLVFDNGTEAVWANRSDGLAIGLITELGLPQIILSMEENPVVAVRAKKLGIPVLQGVRDKRSALERHAAEHGFAVGRIAYIGNDINDLQVMKLVGYPIAPADAAPAIREIAVHVTRAGGGQGVIREIYEDFFGHIRNNG